MRTKAAKPPKARRRIHRSFTIDSALVARAQRLAPPELSGNLNRMISVALSTLVEKFERTRFEREMADMGADASLRGESARISEEFRRAEPDGL